MRVQYILFSLAAILLKTESKEYISAVGDGPQVISTDILARSTEHLASLLFNMVRRNLKMKNIMLSPLSLNYALTGVSLGATEDTRTQIGNLLLHPQNKFNETLFAYRGFTQKIKDEKRLEMIIRLYADEKFKVNPKLLEDLKYLELIIENLSFKFDPTKTTQIINAMVDRDTHHRVPRLLPRKIFNSRTTGAIVTVVRFKAKWLQPFPINNTQVRPFYGFKRLYKVNMMHQKGVYNVAGSERYNFMTIEIPYENGYSLIIILPKKRKGIAELERNIFRLKYGYSEILSINKSGKQIPIDLFIPKFLFEQTHELSASLKRVGLKKMFRRAEQPFKDTLINEFDDEKFIFSNVIHKVIMSADEKGSEVAIEDNPVDEGRSNDESYNPDETDYPDYSESVSSEGALTFNANHPFLYLLIQKSSEIIILTGRYSVPYKV